MIPAELVRAVAEEVRAAVKLYKMKAEGQDDKPVTVYEQHIPDEDFTSDNYYPLVIVSLGEVTDKEDGSEAKLGLTFGVYGEDKGAWLDLLSIMERVRQRLFLNSKLANKFRLILPTKFETIEQQPYPFWFGYATLTYQIGQPNEKMAAEYEIVM